MTKTTCLVLSIWKNAHCQVGFLVGENPHIIASDFFFSFSIRYFSLGDADSSLEISTRGLITKHGSLLKFSLPSCSNSEVISSWRNCSSPRIFSQDSLKILSILPPVSRQQRRIIMSVSLSKPSSRNGSAMEALSESRRIRISIWLKQSPKIETIFVGV